LPQKENIALLQTLKADITECLVTELVPGNSTCISLFVPQNPGVLSGQSQLLRFPSRQAIENSPDAELRLHHVFIAQQGLLDPIDCGSTLLDPNHTMSTKRGPSTTTEANPVVESLFSRVIIAPVLFISFLVSLVVIDRQTSGTVFGKSGGKDGYYHSHQRKLAKREMDSAYQMRSKVIAGMALLSAVMLAVCAWTLEVTWNFWRKGTPLSQ